jgi:hypothetical protein
VASANGDIVTPVLARWATQEWEWARAWTVALVRFLVPENRRGIDGSVGDGTYDPVGIVMAQAVEQLRS